ncbi:MAG: hypothetical protein O2960_11895 [Verrucomicrobia bacterium]|nr:hypothetical protein [Verrucomicrobiota bacterium]
MSIDLTAKNAKSAEMGRYGVPPLGGRASNDLTRVGLSAPDRLKPGLHAHASFFAVKYLCAFAVFFAVVSARAQWETQTVTLKPGWNSVYLHVDASHLVVNEDVPVPIEEIWLWKPVLSPDRFIDNPQRPASGNDWISWDRRAEVSDTLTALIGNAAYLVRNGDAADYVWSLKGKPLPPRYTWTSKGVNLVGFSTPPANPPLFANFLSPVPRLASEGEFYRYDDGDNDLTPTLFKALFNSVRVNRGQAFWIRHANQFNRYFGAFEVTLQNSSGVNFRDFIDQYTLRLRNQTTAEITVTLDLLDSESAPTGQTAIVSKPPLLRRGALSAQNLTYAFTTFDSGQTVTLKPRGEVGSEAEVVLGINRLAMNGNAGDLFAGILRLTDSLGYTQIDLPVSANQASGGATFASGLWVGNAVVNQVRHYLKNYQRDASGNLVREEVTQDGAPYVVASVKEDLGSVARTFNLRLIVHKSADEARLLQRIFHGLDLGGNQVLSKTEDALDPKRLGSARRISAVELPFTSANDGWPFTGQFAQGQTIVAQVNLAYDDYQSNPFLHSYHPDHDVLNATFTAVESRGIESYDIERKITLVIAPPAQDFKSVIAAGNEIIGQYSEEITLKGRGAESRRIDTAGSFVLRRISDIATLTTAP